MAYSRIKTWSNGEALTHTDLNAEFDAVAADSQSKDGADLQAGTVTVSKLASQQAVFSVTVPLISHADALSSGAVATAVPGLQRNLNTQAFHFQIPFNATLIGFSIGCIGSTQGAPTTRNNTAQVFQNSTGRGTALTFSAGDVVNETGLTVALLTTDTLEIRCTTDSGANDGVTGPYGIVHLQATHRAAP